MDVAVEQVIALAVVFLVFAGALSLRLWGSRSRKGPRDGDPDVLQRWASHLYRGGPED